MSDRDSLVNVRRDYLADRVASLKPSGIRKFFDIVATMKDVISLGIGEPDLNEAEGAGVALKNGVRKQTW